MNRHDNTGQRTALATPDNAGNTHTAHDNGDTADPALLDGGH